jgi:tetratricopeptide (TPR) repeat protein
LHVTGANIELAPWLVPLPRPRCFVGRDAQLVQLRAHLSSQHGERLAIYGLGGCGKTALALEFAHWTREHYHLCAVFWVPAISRESFEQAYRDIAKLLCLPGVEDDKTDAKQLVKARLEDENFGPWLLIIDNADDTSILFSDNKEGSSAARLISDLPWSSKGSTIFTTRTRATAIEIAENNVLALGEFASAEAIEILNTRLLPEHQCQLTDIDVVHEFLEMLSFHALAIIQAIAFINRNDVTLPDYINLYRNSESDAIELLNEEFEDKSRYREATKSVATTWSISFEQIQKQDKIAAEHLFFMACIANTDIVSSLFSSRYTRIESMKAIGTLKAYAFITERHSQADGLQGKRQEAPKTFDVHPLIHLAICGFLKACGKWSLQVENTLTRFIENIPDGKSDMREHWRLHWHHAVHLVELQDAHGMKDRPVLLDWITTSERTLGRYQAAERACRQSLEQRTRMLGETDLGTLKCMGNLGQILGCQVRWVEAEDVYKRMLALMKNFLDKDDPHTLTARGDLAMAMLGQSKPLEAERLYRDLLAVHQRERGEKHVQTLITIHDIGAALMKQGEYARAEQCLRDNLDSYKEVLGVGHEDTLTGMSVLGVALNRQSKFSEAESVHREELGLRMNVAITEGLPGTLTCMRRLAYTLAAQEKHTEGEQILRDALVLGERVQGSASMSTLRLRYALADILRTQLKYDEATELASINLTIQEEVLGNNHLYTIESVSFLAALSHDQMRYEDALPLYRRAVTGFQETVGCDHVAYKRCLDNYTWVQRVVKEDRLAAAAKADRATSNADDDQKIVEEPLSNTNDMVLRPRERWRERIKKWRST